MSHLIYSTEAVVLKTEERGESSRLFWLFTEQFGLVIAHAQGVRAGHSKLKHELQPYQLVKVSLVRGREWWRIVNVVASDLALAADRDKKLVPEAADFLLRLIHGEGAHADIFHSLIECPEIWQFKVKAMVSLGYLAEAQIGTDDFANQERLAYLVDLGFAHSQL